MPSLQLEGCFNRYEGNTGNMFYRSNARTIRFVQAWLNRLVDWNIMNDQKVLNLNQYGESVWTKSCDKSFSQIDNRTHYITDSRNFYQWSGTTGPHGVRYCFLNEFRFQTGIMQDFCSVGKNKGSLAVYSLGMMQLGNQRTLDSLEDDENYQEDNRLDFTQFVSWNNPANYSQKRVQDVKKYFFYPTIVHANYCKSKRDFLNNKGLWLVNDNTLRSLLHGREFQDRWQQLNAIGICHRYSLKNTFYPKVDTAYYTHPAIEDLLNDIQDIRQRSNSTSYQDKTLIKYSHIGTVYQLEYSPVVSLRPFYNLDTLSAKNISLEKDVISVDSPLLSFLPRGAFIK